MTLTLTSCKYAPPPRLATKIRDVARDIGFTKPEAGTKLLLIAELVQLLESEHAGTARLARASHDGKSLGAVRPADVSAARDRNVVRKVGAKR